MEEQRTPQEALLEASEKVMNKKTIGQLMMFAGVALAAFGPTSFGLSLLPGLGLIFLGNSVYESGPKKLPKKNGRRYNKKRRSKKRRSYKRRNPSPVRRSERKNRKPYNLIHANLPF